MRKINSTAIVYISDKIGEAWLESVRASDHLIKMISGIVASRSMIIIISISISISISIIFVQAPRRKIGKWS